jgi:hypothetical protein
MNKLHALLDWLLGRKMIDPLAWQEWPELSAPSEAARERSRTYPDSGDQCQCDRCKADPQWRTKLGLLLKCRPGASKVEAK